MNKSMEIDVWSGDWGLPSVDVKCLQILVYCKFSGVPMQVNASNNPFRCALPTLRHEKKALHELGDVVNYLKSKNIHPDYFLDNKEVVGIQAYEQLLQEKLWPAIQFLWWVDEKNYIEFTRPWYAKALPFPWNYYYPGKYESQAKDFISALYGPLDDTSKHLIETQVYSDAEKCLTMLSSRLGESAFFFGKAPTSLDALIFSYLAPILKPPFPHPTLQNYLKGCVNLVAFVDRICNKYYPNLVRDYDKKINEIKKQDSDEFPSKRRHQLLAGLFATIAMISYALSSGLLQVSLIDRDDGFDEIEYIDDESDDATNE